MDTENTPEQEVAPQAEGTQSEQVAETETPADAPAETVADTAKETPVEPAQDWEARYKELQSKFTKTAQEKAELEKMVNPVEYAPTEETSENPFDEATTSGVMTLAEKAAEAAWEKREAAKWVKQNADDLKDPIVDARTRDLIRQGVDRDDALAQAKKELSSRITPVQKEALAEGVKEGQELAQKKGQMGAVGTSGTNPDVDEKKLSATEYAKLHGIPRV